MERMLEKLAKQLCAYDQASLTALWPKYEAKVRAFESSKQWEEAVVILCMIQAIRWKNQLFNYKLAESSSPSNEDMPPQFMPFAEGSAQNTPAAEKINTDSKRKATLLHFPDKKNR